MKTFAKIFYINFRQLYGGKGMTLIELMVMHRKIFALVDNLHDLCCRGTKDYRQALANVQDYNMTKVLSRKCSVPSKTGDIKENFCDFNILYAIQMDIELYNYVDMLMRDFKSGKLAAEVSKKKDGLKREEEDKTDGPRLNAGLVLLTMDLAPHDMTFKRDNADVMNNFFINIVTRSYTNIDELLKSNTENTEQNKQKETLKELETVKDHWSQNLLEDVNQNFDKWDKKIIEAKKDTGENLFVPQKAIKHVEKFVSNT